MERHIGVWHKETMPQKGEVAELIIDGNSIEFYSRFHGEVFPTTFIGNDGEFSYKVFVNGSSRSSSKKTLEYTSAHRVFYVLMQNFAFSKGTDISGIKEFSFYIPEIIDWLGVTTVSYDSVTEVGLVAAEKHLEPIVINKGNPHVELYFESKSYESILSDDRTEITLKKEPRIKVEYEVPQNIQSVMDDIECLMQFFGLLIGTVSTAQDIRLSVEGQDLKSWLFFNRDFSYNVMTRGITNRPRTYFYIVKDKLERYYSNWRTFYLDDSYSLLRRIYFSVNGRKEIFAEEIFVEYMRILDGYHTRISGDEESKRKLKDALKASKNAIKKLIFTDEGRPLFEEPIKSVIPEWKYNSSHVEDIAGWIAAGYLAKTPLSYRLQELDSQHLCIMSRNAVMIEKRRSNKSEIENKTEYELIQLFFKELGDTRNYYSHYKLDKSGVLEIGQISTSINVLKATIISILFYHMGMEEDLIRKILEFDDELHFETMVLRAEGERPFEPPARLIVDEIKNSEEKPGFFKKLINRIRGYVHGR